MFLWLLLQSVACLNSFLVHVPAHNSLCFDAQLKPGDRFDLSFQVIDGGRNDVDFYVHSPDQRLIHQSNKQSSHTFGFNADTDGVHEYCFDNKMSSVSEKAVTFTVHGPEEQNKYHERIKNSEPNHEGLTKELWQLADGLSALHDEQTYFVYREQQHHDVASSVKSRILWWSIIQSCVLIAVCVFQVNYLKRFFEVRRVI